MKNTTKLGMMACLCLMLGISSLIPSGMIVIDSDETVTVDNALRLAGEPTSVDNITIDDTEASGIQWVDFEAEDWLTGSGTEEEPYVISNVEITRSELGQWDYSINISNSEAYFEIDAVIFAEGYALIWLENVANGKIINCEFSNVRNLLYARNVENITFSHNEVEGSEAISSIFDFQEGTKNLVFSHNNISSLDCSGGVTVFGAYDQLDDIYIGYNEFNDIDGDRIFAFYHGSSVSNLNIEYNRLEDTPTFFTVDGVEGIVDGIKVHNNTMLDISKPLYIEYASNITISNNYINQTTSSIQLDNIDMCHIHDNTVLNVIPSGMGQIIDLVHVNNVTIEDNYFDTVGGSFVSAQVFYNLSILNNEFYNGHGFGIQAIGNTLKIIGNIMKNLETVAIPHTAFIINMMILGQAIKNVEIIGNTLENSIDGVVFMNASSILIEDNTIVSSGVDTATLTGQSGINCYNTAGLEIMTNDISGFKYGFFSGGEDLVLEVPQPMNIPANNSGVIITGNILTENDIGVKIGKIDGLTFNTNTFTDNGIALLVNTTDDITIELNDFEDNEKSIDLNGVSNSLIMNNTIDIGEYGIDLKESSSNIFYGNMIKNQTDYGIRVRSGSNENLFYCNYFFSNDAHARDDGSSNNWNTTSIGNYWDDYEGFDNDGDGIGDTPHPITGSAESFDYLPIWFIAEPVDDDDDDEEPIDDDDDDEEPIDDDDSLPLIFVIVPIVVSLGAIGAVVIYILWKRRATTIVSV